MSEVTAPFETGDAVLCHNAAQRGDAEAVCMENEVYSFTELSMMAASAARWMITEGVKPGDCVVYLGGAAPQFFALFFAVARMGLCLVPLNWRLSATEIQAQIMQVAPALTIVEADCEPLVEGHAGPRVALQDFIAICGSAPAGDEGLDAIPADPQRSQRPFLIMFTSGTTGDPKGVTFTQSKFFMARRQDMEMGVWYRWQKGEKSLVAAPLFHIAGLGWAATALYFGVGVVLVSRFSPPAMFEAVTLHRPTRVLIVPVMYLLMRESEGFADVDWTCFNIIAYGAAPMPSALLAAAQRDFSTAHFLHLYGMTETLGSATFLTPQEHGDPSLAGSAGRPMPGMELKICDAEGRECPAGVVGEVLLRSASMMEGYWQRPDATADALCDGWYRTGDGGFLSESGHLFLKDRVKDMVISGGENVYPSEVEDVLGRLPGVMDAAVFGVPHRRWGEEITAAIVLAPGAELTADDVIGHVRAQIASYKCPRVVHFVDMLPRNTSGKILKTALRARFSADTAG